MFGIGGQELILLMLIGLIVLGPERLPRIANQMGNWLGQARRMTRVMKRQLEEELDLNKPPDIRPPPVAREPSTRDAVTTKTKEAEKGSEEETQSAEPEYELPRDDDDFSPAHGDDEPGTGVNDEPDVAEQSELALEESVDDDRKAAS